MQYTYRPDEAEIMERARGLLRPRAAEGGDTASLPIRVAEEGRRKRSLTTCHRFSLYERPRYPAPKDSGAFVPASSARIDDDRNLTDGARRCARKLLELGYRDARSSRELAITVGYIAKALGRCRRSVQRYLGLLEREGYVRLEVAVNLKSRMCTGLVVRLLEPLFPRHQRERWPEKPGNPDATRESQIQSLRSKEEGSRVRVARESWALCCMNGVFRALMKTNPLASLPTVLGT